MKSDRATQGVVIRSGFAFAMLAAGCTWQGPSLAGYEGLQWEVISFYGARAMEQNAMCPQSQMTAITNADVVEDTPERVMMNIRYHYRDDGQSVDYAGGDVSTCDGWGQRTFTFTRAGNDRLIAQGMTGLQRRS